MFCQVYFHSALYCLAGLLSGELTAIKTNCLRLHNLPKGGVIAVNRVDLRDPAHIILHQLVNAGADFHAWDTVMAEKLLEICDKYGLKLHTDMTMASSLDEFYSLAGTEPFGLPDSEVSSPGYVFEDGSFKAEGFIEIDGDNTIFTVSKYVSGTMPPFSAYLAEPENYQEWSYTTAGGCTVCIDWNTKADDMGHTVLIFYSQQDACIRLSSSVPGGPEQAEKLAEMFDFEKACAGS